MTAEESADYRPVQAQPHRFLRPNQSRLPSHRYTLRLARRCGRGLLRMGPSHRFHRCYRSPGGHLALPRPLSTHRQSALRSRFAED